MGSSEVLRRVFNTIVDVLAVLAEDEDYVFLGNGRLEIAKLKVDGRWIIVRYDGESIYIRGGRE